jgi:V-type H+-transporting ATPase subunit d
MRACGAFQSNAQGYRDLYQTVLIDTPVGKYFSRVLEATGVAGGGTGEVRNVLEEVEIEIIKSSLLKFWIEDFHAFCTTLGGETSEIMCDLLACRADAMTVNIVLNSFGTSLNEDVSRGGDRQRLMPNVGYLYPAVTAKLAAVNDEDSLGIVMNMFPSYAKIWQQLGSGGSNSDDQTLDDVLFKRDVRALELAFEGQMHFAPFYAYPKLKEQETRNLIWIAECVLQQQKGEIGKYVPVFDMNSEWRAAGSRRT